MEIHGEILTKKCSKCSEFKEYTEFYKGEDKYGLKYWCKVCHNNDVTKRQPKYRNKYQIKKRKENWDRTFEYLGGRVCADCKAESEAPIFDLHHIDNNKEATPSALMHLSWDKVKTEIDKCIVLCSNCHRIRHWKDTATNGNNP